MRGERRTSSPPSFSRPARDWRAGRAATHRSSRLRIIFRGCLNLRFKCSRKVTVDLSGRACSPGRAYPRARRDMPAGNTPFLHRLCSGPITFRRSIYSSVKEGWIRRPVSGQIRNSAVPTLRLLFVRPRSPLRFRLDTSDAKHLKKVFVGYRFWKWRVLVVGGC